MIQDCAEGCKTQKEELLSWAKQIVASMHTLKWMLMTVSGLLVGIVITGRGLLSSLNALYIGNGLKKVEYA